MKATLILMALLVAGVHGEEDVDSADFAGAVMNKNAFASGRGCVITGDGEMAYVNSRGSIISSRGFYYKSGNSYVGPDGTYVSRSGNYFYGTTSTIKAGGAYMNNGGVFVGRNKDKD